MQFRWRKKSGCRSNGLCGSTLTRPVFLPVRFTKPMTDPYKMRLGFCGSNVGQVSGSGQILPPPPSLQASCGPIRIASMSAILIDPQPTVSDKESMTSPLLLQIRPPMPVGPKLPKALPSKYLTNPSGGGLQLRWHTCLGTKEKSIPFQFLIMEPIESAKTSEGWKPTMLQKI